MPPRALKRKSDQLQDDVAKLGQNLALKMADANLEEVVALLRKDPDQTAGVLDLLRRGALKPAQKSAADDPGDILRSSLNKMCLIPEAMAREFLAPLLPEAEEFLACKKKKFLLELLCFVTDIDSGSALCSKRKSVLLATFQVRFISKGRRLQGASWSDVDDEAHFWQTHGFFRIDGNQVHHISGGQCTLPSEFQNGAEWQIIDNHSLFKATISCGRFLKVKCADVFCQTGVSLTKPLYMDAVPVQTEADDQDAPLQQLPPGMQATGSSTSAGSSPAPSLPSISTPGAADASEEQPDDAAAGSNNLFATFVYECW